MKSVPYRCPKCVEEGTYHHMLRFGDGPVPNCDNHKKKPEDPPVEMVPVEKKEKRN